MWNYNFKKTLGIVLIFLLWHIFFEFCECIDKSKHEKVDESKQLGGDDGGENRKREREGKRRHSPEKNDWDSYMAHHKKKYKDDADRTRRQKHFLKKEKQVSEHNARFAQKLVTFEKELNKFADEDPDELKINRRGFKPLTEAEEKEAATNSDPGQLGRVLNTFLKITLPKSLDYRASGAVSPVKDQGDCGCCYAFAAVGALESQMFLKTKQMKILSEQNVLNCDTSNLACEGGNYLKAWKYLTQPGRIHDDPTVPFVSGETKTKGNCVTQPVPALATKKVSSFKLLGKNETLIQEYLVKIGPLAISLNSDNLFTYSNGIYDCPPEDSDVNHSVLLIGYDTSDTGVPYWILKNQWGTNWGMDGYFFLKRGTNACGINTQAAFPTI